MHITLYYVLRENNAKTHEVTIYSALENHATSSDTRYHNVTSCNNLLTNFKHSYFKAILLFRVVVNK